MLSEVITPVVEVDIRYRAEISTVRCISGDKVGHKMRLPNGSVQNHLKQAEVHVHLTKIAFSICIDYY